MSFNLMIPNMNQPLSHLITSILLVTSAFLLRSLLIKSIRSNNWKVEDKRKWLVFIRNWTTISVAAGLLIIWFTQLQTFALSIVAVTAALIISGKEFILCFHGGILRAFNNSFRVGDRIEVDGIRGDVIDTNLFTTRILEIGPQNYTHQYTGRSILLPNSIFLSKAVVNESFMDEVVLHVFKVPFKRSEDWKKAQECMMEAAVIECKDLIEKAKKNLSHIGHREGLEMPDAEPRITFQLPNSSDIEMIVRVPAPATKKGNMEQAILKRFMSKYPQSL